MVFVDGLKMARAPEAGQAIGILDPLNPNDVLLIEIFRGPAATTLYGTDASGGVIRIYTKHGNPSAELTSDPRARCLP
jgi:outer membrane cobalamin receptor